MKKPARSRTKRSKKVRKGDLRTPKEEKGRGKLTSRQRLWAGAGVILLVAFLAYSPVFQAGFIWDDDDYVTENVHLRSFQGLGRIWFDLGATPQYYPLVHTSFWIDYHLWGLNPAGYHVENILIHGFNAVLLWLALWGLGTPGAWFAALIFALHPVHVESVAWITERKNLLSGFFYLASLLAYLGFANLRYPLSKRKSPDPLRSQPEKRQWRLYMLAFVLYLMALLSKTVTAGLPVAILIILWWKKGRLRLKDIYPLAPMLLAGALFGLLTAWMERGTVGATGSEWELSLLERCLVAGRAPWFYAGKLIFPIQLTFIYPRWEINAGAPWQYIYPAGAIIALIVLWRSRGKTGRGPLAAALFFIVTLFPALGFFNVYPMLFSFVADHFQYLASIGLIALMAGVITVVLKNYGGIHRLALSGFCAVLLVLTWRQAHIYKNPEALWRDTLRKNPRSWMPHNNLGMILADQGKLDEAVAHYREGIRLRPDDAIGHYNLAGVLDEKGDYERAVGHYQTAIRLKPDFPDALCNLGADLVILGRYEEASEYLKKALRLNPLHTRALDNMGVLLAKKGEYEKAISLYKKAARLDPNYFKAWYNMAVSYTRMDRLDQAVRCYQKALERNPQLVQAWNNLGLIYASQQKWEIAIQHYRAAIDVYPGFLDAHLNLADVLAQTGKRDEAARHYRFVLEKNPDDPSALGGLKSLGVKK